VAVRAVDGTLRELGEKDLYLETANHKILKFRLLAKTQFRDKEGESVRDSLLKPGDQLSVQVNGDDPETALRVILTRNGLQAERTAAGRPFDHDSAKLPVEADTHSAGSMEVAAEPSTGSRANTSGNDDAATSASVNPPSADPPQPRQNPGTARTVDAPVAEPSPQAEKAKGPPRVGSPEDDIIDAARNAADRLNDGLPNFIVKQNTARYFSTTFPARWRAQDVVTAEVVSVGGKEDYRNILVNGKPSNRPSKKPAPGRQANSKPPSRVCYLRTPRLGSARPKTIRSTDVPRTRIPLPFNRRIRLGTSTLRMAPQRLRLTAGRFGSTRKLAM